VFSIGGDFGTPVSPAQAATIAAAIAALSPTVNLDSVMSTSTIWTAVRVEARSVTGVLETLGEANKVTPNTGSGGTPHPFQTSIVASLRTATPGASGRGRLFWPATGISVQVPTLRPSSSVVNGYITGLKALLAGTTTAIDATLDGVSLAVWSRKNAQLYPVTSIQAGDVLDVQRRRRDNLVEAVSTQAYP
jgi:hypothetical protein